MSVLQGLLRGRHQPFIRLFIAVAIIAFAAVIRLSAIAH
jgi:hypothetical protein